MFFSVYRTYPFPTLRAALSLCGLPASRRGRYWLGKTHPYCIFLITYSYANNYLVNPRHWKLQLLFYITINFRPWPFVVLHSITMIAKAAKSSDTLKHGFCIHRMFTTGQKEKLHYQWNLDRLVACKNTCSGRLTFHVTVANSILVQREFYFPFIEAGQNFCSSEANNLSCSLKEVFTSGYQLKIQVLWDKTPCRLVNSYRHFERSNFLWNFVNSWTRRHTFLNFILRIPSCPPVVFTKNIKHRT
jgi:hypothetical protein